VDGWCTKEEKFNNWSGDPEQKKAFKKNTDMLA
jgi:hypothetical protein